MLTFLTFHFTQKEKFLWLMDIDSTLKWHLCATYWREDYMRKNKLVSREQFRIFYYDAVDTPRDFDAEIEKINDDVNFQKIF